MTRLHFYKAVNYHQTGTVYFFHRRIAFKNPRLAKYKEVHWASQHIGRVGVTVTRNKKTTICITRQNNLFFTLLLLFHETCHALIDIVFSDEKTWEFSEQLHDKIDKHI